MEGGIIIRLGRNRVPPVLEREAPHHTADRFHTALWSNMLKSRVSSFKDVHR
jgi:hypothetical protein